MRREFFRSISSLEGIHYVREIFLELRYLYFCANHFMSDTFYIQFRFNVKVTNIFIFNLDSTYVNVKVTNILCCKYLLELNFAFQCSSLEIGPNLSVSYKTNRSLGYPFLLFLPNPPHINTRCLTHFHALTENRGGLENWHYH